MVFQNPDNQFVGATVEDDVAFGLENKGVPYEEMASRVQEALEFVGCQNLRIESQLDYLEAKTTCGYRRYCSYETIYFDFG